MLYHSFTASKSLMPLDDFHALFSLYVHMYVHLFIVKLVVLV